MVKIALLMAEGDDAPADPVAYASRETSLDPGETPYLVALFRLGGQDLSSTLAVAANLYEYTRRFDAVLVAGSAVSGDVQRARAERAARLLELTCGYGNVVVAQEDPR